MLVNIIRNGKCPTKLNFGCGTNILPCFWNVDIHIEKHLLDVALDGTWVSEGFVKSPHDFPRNHFNTILAEMCLEHIHQDLIPNILFSFYHSLAEDGGLEIIVPNFYKLAKSLVELEENDSGLIYVDGMRNVTNEFLDPSMDDIGFARGHQSIWTKKSAYRWLHNEGFINMGFTEIDNWHVKITAIKPANNFYGSPINRHE